MSRIRPAIAMVMLAPAGAGAQASGDVGTGAITLRASNVSRAAIEPMLPMCERAAGTKVLVEYANNPAVAEAIGKGASFDLVVLEAGMLRELARARRVTPESVRPLAALRMGIATRDATVSVRADSVSAFRKVLLGARSIGYAGDGHSGVVFLDIVDRLRMRASLAGKLMPFTGGYPGAVAASERTQLIVAPFFKPLPAPLRLVGYFPRSLDADVAIAIGASAAARPGSAAFIDCLGSPAAKAIFRARGYRSDP